MIQLLKQSGCLLLACLLGIVFLRSLNTFYRIILLSALFALFIFCFSWLLTEVQFYAFTRRHNHWVFNLAMPIDTALLSAAGIVSLHASQMKRVIMAGYSLFAITYALQVYLQGFNNFANYAASIAGLLIVGIYMVILFRLLRKNTPLTSILPDCFICTALILYFAGIIPYLNYMYFIQQFGEARLKVYNIIVLNLGNIRYLCTALAFVLYARQHRIALAQKT